MKQVCVKASTCSRTAATTLGAALPTLTTAMPAPRSISELPSTSTSTPPPARSMNTGSVVLTPADTVAARPAASARERGPAPGGGGGGGGGAGMSGNPPPPLRGSLGAGKQIGTGGSSKRSRVAPIALPTAEAPLSKRTWEGSRGGHRPHLPQPGTRVRQAAHRGVHRAGDLAVAVDGAAGAWPHASRADLLGNPPCREPEEDPAGRFDATMWNPRSGTHDLRQGTADGGRHAGLGRSRPGRGCANS